MTYVDRKNEVVLLKNISIFGPVPNTAVILSNSLFDSLLGDIVILVFE